MKTETSRLWSYPGDLSRVNCSCSRFRRRMADSWCAGLPGYQRFDSLGRGGERQYLCRHAGARRHQRVLAARESSSSFTRRRKGIAPTFALAALTMRTAYITLSGYGQLFEAQWPRPGLRLVA